MSIARGNVREAANGAYCGKKKNAKGTHGPLQWTKEEIEKPERPVKKGKFPQ